MNNQIYTPHQMDWPTLSFDFVLEETEWGCSIESANVAKLLDTLGFNAIKFEPEHMQVLMRHLVNNVIEKILEHIGMLPELNHCWPVFKSHELLNKLSWQNPESKLRKESILHWVSRAQLSPQAKKDGMSETSVLDKLKVVLANSLSHLNVDFGESRNTPVPPKRQKTINNIPCGACIMLFNENESGFVVVNIRPENFLEICYEKPFSKAFGGGFHSAVLAWRASPQILEISQLGSSGFSTNEFKFKFPNDKNETLMAIPLSQVIRKNKSSLDEIRHSVEQFFGPNSVMLIQEVPITERGYGHEVKWIKTQMEGFLSKQEALAIDSSINVPISMHLEKKVVPKRKML